MRVYQPCIQIILIKARRRKAIAPNKAIDERYNRYARIDLTPFLADSGAASITKSVRQPAGTFTLSFPDQPIQGVSVYYLIEPMDMVEIRASQGSDLPILMRGFVSTIDRSTATTQDGKPMRFVSVSGHDYGKILQTIQMLYLPFMDNLTAAYINENRWFMVYGGNGEYKAKPAQEFIKNALDGSINKYLSAITVTQKPQDNSGVIRRMTGEVTVSGTVSPFTPNSFVDVSLYEMLKTMMDAPVFNEIYTRDDPNAVTLVVRPIPFKSLDGQFIQGRTETLDISTEDVISAKYARSDNAVANYYWVTSSATSLSNNIDMLKYTALSGNTEKFVLFNYLNSLRDVFSIRKMETQTLLWPGEYRHSDSPNEQQLTAANTDLNHWLIYRRELLAQLNKDNAIYESGNLVVRGNEAIKPGNYIRLQDGADVLGEVYAHTVKHVFNPFRDYLTTVEFDRGTFFYDTVKV